jgi:hypothetical protein
MSLSNFRELQTTIGGFIAAVAVYWYQIGLKIPETADELVQLIVPAILIASGVSLPNVTSKK